MSPPVLEGASGIRVHHLNCGTICPLARRWVNGDGGLFRRGRMICHVLLVETEQGLVLVDSGIGARDVADRRAFHAPLRAVGGFAFLEAETAIAQVRGLGFRPEDVRHMVVTHLDLDHAGGIADFPWATIHVHATEHQAAMNPPSFIERQRYLQVQWAHGPRWRTYSEEGEPWLGLTAIRPLEGVPGVALVPLFGHSRGHSGVLVERPGAPAQLHAGDAFFFRDELADPPRCPPGLAAFQSLVNIDPRARRENQRRLRQLHRDHRDQVEIFCAHDPAMMPA